jgi:hypothetical protein
VFTATARVTPNAAVCGYSGNGCILGQHLGRGPAGHRCGRAFTW